jgi:hypothetical protein
VRNEDDYRLTPAVQPGANINPFSLPYRLIVNNLLALLRLTGWRPVGCAGRSVAFAVEAWLVHT